MEALESRVMPAATIVGLPGAGDTRTFVDPSGDTVTVRVSGTSGTATFTDATAGTVEDGEAIAGVAITGASPDFTLTYSFDASGDIADNLGTQEDEFFDSDDTVLMGDITSTRVIKGIFTVPLNNDGAPKGAFTLGSFVGPGFSLHGGLSADNLVGRTADDLGVQINNLETNRSLNFRGNVDGDILIKGNLNGNIAFGSGVTATSDITVRGSVSTNGKIAGNGNYLGTATFNGVFSGSATIDGDVDGNWTFNSSVPSAAKLLANHWDNVNALRSFGGQIVSDDEINLDVGGSITGTAKLTASGDVYLDVTGSILSGAIIASSSEVSATVGGNVSGTINNLDGDLTLNIGGSLSGATIDSASTVSISVGRGITNSKISGSEVSIEVTGGITDSTIFATSDLSVDVTGSVTRSKLITESSTASVTISGNLVDSQITNTSYDVELYVGGNMVNSTVFSGSSDVTVEVRGYVSRSSISADEEVTLSVGGTLSSTRVVSADSDIVANIGGSVSDSKFQGLGSEPVEITVGAAVVLTLPDVDVTIAGRLSNMTRTVVEADSNVTLDITGSLSSSRVVAPFVDLTTGLDVISSSITATNDDLSAVIGRDLLGSSISGTSLVSVDVTRNMTRSSVIGIKDDMTLDVGGNMTSSTASSASSTISATVGGNFTASRLTGYGIDLDVEGNASGTLTAHGSDIDLIVDGSFTGIATTGNDIDAELGSLNGTLAAANDLDLLVTGNVSASSVIQANEVDSFRVEGTFAGKLTAVYFDSDEGDGTNDLVVGNVLSTAKFNIGVFNGNADEVYRFGGKFLGHMAISQTLNVNLEFGGDVNTIAIGGSIGEDNIGGSDGGEDEPNTITVNGKLNYLSSNSLFISTGDGDGNFQDGDGVVTGSLVTNGFNTVIPAIVAP